MTAEPRDDGELLRRTDAMRANADRVRAYPSYSVRQLADDARWLMGEYAERLGQLAAADRENAELRGEVERLREGYRVVCDQAERADLLQFQLAAAQAKLAETLAWVAKAEPYPDLNGNKFAGLRAALSAAPQPAPDDDAEDDAEDDASPFPCWDLGHAVAKRDGAWVCVECSEPEPPASDEPARCEHGLTAAHFLPVDQKPVRGGCPGPAASGTPDGGS